MEEERGSEFKALAEQALEPFSGPDKESMQKLLILNYLPNFYENVENRPKHEDFTKNVEFLKSLFGFKNEMTNSTIMEFYKKIFPQNDEKSTKIENVKVSSECANLKRSRKSKK